MLEPLASFLSEADERDFAAFCVDPLLIVDPFEPDDDTGFKTIQIKADQAATIGFTVARVRKRPGANAFSMMVTVGRASNNDIDLKEKGVSKFHAYLRQEGGRWTITDAGSSFGTVVQGRTLEPRTERAPLATGDEVRLGPGIRMVFVATADAQQFLREAAARGRFHSSPNR